MLPSYFIRKHFWFIKLLFMMQPTGSQTLYRPVAVGPHMETESPTAFRSSNCEMRLKRREAAGTGRNQCYRSPCGGCDRDLCRAEGSAHLPSTPGNCAHRRAPPGASLTEGSPSPRQVPSRTTTPASPIPPEEPFPPGPDTRSGV